MEEVVVPVVRPVDALPLRVDRLACGRRSVEPMIEQELARSMRGLECVAVARGAVILDQAPNRGKALVKRRPPCARVDVAVPAAVGPLRSKKNVDEVADLFIACHTQPAGNWSATSSTFLDRKSTRLNSSHVRISYAVFCLKKKNN